MKPVDTIEVKMCSRCMLNSGVPGIQFDGKGVCNYCKIHDELDRQHPLDDRGKQRLKGIIDEIKSKGKISYNGNIEKINKYSYREMARKFAEVLDQVTSK